MGRYRQLMTVRPSPASALAVTLACLAGLLVLTALRYQPSAPLAEDAPAEMFSADRAMAALAPLLGDGRPHPMGSAANEAVRERIAARLAALGYAVETQTGLACDEPAGVCGSPVNLLARLPGTRGRDDNAVVLAAHYDSVPAGAGAADDGAGVAALLEIARALQQGPALRHTVIFLFTDGEEAGLLGARLFVNRHSWARQVKAAINLEARGTSGPSLLFETGSANAWLLATYAGAVPEPLTNSLYYVVYKLLPNDTDFSVFKAAGYQGYNFAFIGDVARYHTPADSLANLDRSSLQHQGDNALRAVRALADAPLAAPPAGEAVYADVFRLGLARWPTQWAVPLALILFAGLLAVCVVLLIRRRLTRRQLLWGLGNALLVVVGGSLAASGLFVVLRMAGVLPASSGPAWIATPWPGLLAFAALAFAASSAISLLLGHRAGFRGALLGYALLLAALGVGLALTLPGASFLPLLPATVTWLACLPATLGAAPAVRSRGLVASLPGLAAFAVLLPLTIFLYDAMGTLAWPVLTGALCLGSSGLGALLAGCSRALRQGLAGVTTLLVLAGIAATLFLPPYSAQVPQRVNLEYRQDDAPGRAAWIARAAGRLPAELAAAAAFSAPSAAPGESLYPAPGPAVTHAAAAPDLRLPAPVMEVLAATPADKLVRYRARLHSPRDAPLLQLRFAPDSGVRSLVLDNGSDRLPLRLRPGPDGWPRLTLHSPPPASRWEISFEAPRRNAVTMDLRDATYGLPPAGGALQAARNLRGTPSREGDLSVVRRTLRLPPPD